MRSQNWDRLEFRALKTGLVSLVYRAPRAGTSLLIYLGRNSGTHDVLTVKSRHKSDGLIN